MTGGASRESESRRAFLGALIRGAAAGFAWPSLTAFAARAAEGDGPGGDGDGLIEAALYHTLEDGRTACLICPHACVLKPGERGRCRTRMNRDGRLVTLGYGNPCILSVDPIEKGPLNHFYPGSETVTLAVGGCNLRCRYCQNWEWSQKGPDQVKRRFDLSPARAVHHVASKDLRTVTFSYTDVIGFYEYAADIMDIGKRTGLRFAAATNGFASPSLIKRAAKRLDAVTVGLKGFDETFYREVCGASLKPVLDAIVAFRESGGPWVEITTLVVPGLNDDPKRLKRMARWIVKNAGKDVPWHLGRFVPRYKLANVPRTPLSTLDRALKIGLDAGLEHVYTSNVAPHKGNHTYCPRCGKILVERVGFKVIATKLSHGRCPCGHGIPGRFDETHER